MWPILSRLAKYPWIIPTIVFTLLILGASQMHELWGDEAETALFGRNIIRYGVPKGWDGTNIMGINNAVVLDKNLINHTSPWLQYYLVALSFKFFGESSFTARLPFIILAILTQPLIYYVAKKITGDKITAIFTSIISALSVQGILFGFQARYYQATNFFGLLMLLSIWKITSEKMSLRAPSVVEGRGNPIMNKIALAAFDAVSLALAMTKQQWLWSFLFVFSSAGFFYSNYVSFAAFFAAVVISLLIYQAWLTVSLRGPASMRSLRRGRGNPIMHQIASFIAYISLLTLPILILTLPWYIIMQPFSSRGVITLGSLTEFIFTFTTLFWEGIYPFHHNGTFPVGMLLIYVCLLIYLIYKSKNIRQLIFWFILPFFYIFIMDLFSTVAYVDTVFVHARYTTVILPVLFILVGVIFSYLWRLNKFTALCIFAIYLFTNLLTFQAPRSYLFYLLREIVSPYQTPEAVVADFLRTKSQPGQTAFVNLDRDHEPLIFFLGDRLKFVNRVSLINTRIFPTNRGIIPRYIYDFRQAPDWVILYSKRGDDGTFFTMDYHPLPPEVNLKDDYIEHKFPIFFSDLSRPEIDHRSFSGIIPTNPIDFVYIYEKR